MCEFVSVGTVGQIPEGSGKRFSVAGRMVGVFLFKGRYYALDDECPHMGAPLSLGDIRNGTVICDRHQWAFRLNDGTCPDTPELTAETFEVRVRGDQIQVRVPPAKEHARPDQSLPGRG